MKRQNQIQTHEAADIASAQLLGQLIGDVNAEALHRSQLSADDAEKLTIIEGAADAFGQSGRAARAHDDPEGDATANGIVAAAKRYVRDTRARDEEDVAGIDIGGLRIESEGHRWKLQRIGAAVEKLIAEYIAHRRTVCSRSDDREQKLATAIVALRKNEITSGLLKVMEFVMRGQHGVGEFSGVEVDALRAVGAFGNAVNCLQVAIDFMRVQNNPPDLPDDIYAAGIADKLRRDFEASLRSAITA